MRIVFMGTPDIAVPALDALHAHHEVALVVTQPDKPAGRGRHMAPPPVKARARELSLPVSQPHRARDAEFLETLRAVRPECIAVVAYGQILPQSVLDLPSDYRKNSGCVNLHFSLLPRWRGAAPVQHAILAGDQETGMTTQWMAFKLDAGDIMLQERIPILPQETSGELLHRLAQPGAQMLAHALRLIAEGNAPRVPQNESHITLAPQFTREDGRIRWEHSAAAINNQVRALNPWPAAWCAWREDTLKIWRACPLPDDTLGNSGDKSSVKREAGTLIALEKRLLVATGEGILELLEVQAPGKGRMSAHDWVRGARLMPAEKLQ